MILLFDTGRFCRFICNNRRTTDFEQTVEFLLFIDCIRSYSDAVSHGSFDKFICGKTVVGMKSFGPDGLGVNPRHKQTILEQRGDFYFRG
mgnify:CR=1 FL=1